MIYKDVLKRIGNTPLVELTKLNPYGPAIRILAKVESVNPGGSIKDRVALAMIEAAEKSGELTADKIIIEATSGNTGIGLAMVAAVKGYRLMLLMSELASEERKMILKGYGADIRLTPGHLSTDGAIEEAYRLYRESPEKYVLMDQYNNLSSIEAHFKGTGREIWEQTAGQVTHVVSSIGTTGTCMGITKRMRLESDAVKVIAVEPYAGHKIQGLKNMLESYPPGIWDRNAPDNIIHVEDEIAFALTRRLAKEEGLFVGMSSGAALAGALKIAETLANQGQQGTLVTIFPDSGERYLSTSLFASPSYLGVQLVSMDTCAHKTVAYGATKTLFTIGPGMETPDDPDAWRRMVLGDVLARWLEYKGGQVTMAVGLADLDDRTLSLARQKQKKRTDFIHDKIHTLKKIAHTLGLGENICFVPASAGNALSLELVQSLTGKGLAYEKLRSVYFDVTRDARYGTMACVDMEKAGMGRIISDTYLKDNSKDFTLFKRASLQDIKEGEALESQWGKVRPSWFLQMTGAAASELEHIDILLASEAHRFPHLENLRALLGAANKEPNIWLMNAQVESEAEYGINDLLTFAGNAKALRMWLLSGAYHKPLLATQESIFMWVRNWTRVQETVGTLLLIHDTNHTAKNAENALIHEAEQAIFDLKTGFTEAMEANVSLHHFWPKLFQFSKNISTLCAQDMMNTASAKACLRELRKINRVLNILDESLLPLPRSEWPEKIQVLVQQRLQARKDKNFAESDRIRDTLAQLGYRVEDTAQGVRLYAIR